MSGSPLRWIAPLLVLPLAGWEPLWRADPDVSAGNRAYADKRYDDALAAYERAREAGVDDHALAYDVGTAMIGKADAISDEQARSQAYAEAMEHLAEAARSKDPSLAARAHYNRGNVLMKQKQLEGAIDAYKDALRKDPNLESARVNLELALRHRERQRQQQQQQGQGQQGQGQQGQGQQGQGQQGQGQQGQGQQGQGQQGQGQDQQGPQQGGAGDSQQPPQNGQGGGGDPPSNDPKDPSQGQGGQGDDAQGQPPQAGQGQGGGSGQDPTQGQPRWPRDDTEADTPDTPRDSKLDQLEEMSRQQRRDQVRRKSGGDYRWQQEKDW